MVTEVNTGRTRLAESWNHQALLSVTLAGVCQPAARYSASLALKKKKKTIENKQVLTLTFKNVPLLLCASCWAVPLI